MSNLQDEPTTPILDLRPKPKQPKPKQLQPGFRTDAQQELLRQADERAWQLLLKLRFAAPLALHQLAYGKSSLGFDFGEVAFRSRMQKHQRKGRWIVDRLGSRPESVVYLSRRAPEVYESTYDQAAPTYNVDTARRGWLRSWAWAELLPWNVDAGFTVLTNYSTQRDRLRGQPAYVDYVNLLDRFVAGEPTPVSFDYCRGPTKSDRLWLVVEDPHKSIEAQMAVFSTFLKATPGFTRNVVFRPVDELSAWSPTKKTWVRKSGRLARALTLLKEMGCTVVVEPCVRHLQVEN